jgi:cation transport regulator
MDSNALPNLPRLIQDLVPLHGQRIYREAYERALRQTGGDSARAEVLAWEALRGEYAETADGSWLRRDEL